MSCITITLGFSNNKLNACKSFYTTPTTIYSDFLNFSQSTILYSNSTCTTYAPQGYYSDGIVVRFFDATLNKLLKVESCQLPMVFNGCCGGVQSQTFLVNNVNFIDTNTGFPLSVSYNGFCYQYSSVLSTQNPIATFTNFQYRTCESCVNDFPCLVTPTPTPTPSPTPSAQPTSLYLKSCCDDTVYKSLGDIKREIGRVILIAPYNYCYSVISDISLPSQVPTINDYQWEYVSNCSSSKCQFCPPPPTGSIPYVPPGKTDPCFFSTIQPLGIECNVVQPEPNNLFTGILDVTISGGTPPYTVVWSPGGIGKTIYYQGPGVYSVTVTDLWKDFTATTVCTLEEPFVCGFVPSITEFILPTPTPTPTPTVTVTPSPQPSLTPTITTTPTITPTISVTPTITKSPTPTVTKTPTMTPSSSSSNCGCYTITNTNSYNTLAIKYYNCSGAVINLAIPPNSFGKFCGTGVTTAGQGTFIGPCDGACTGTYPNT